MRRTTIAILLAVAVGPQTMAEDLTLDDFKTLDGWRLSYDAGSYYRGAGTQEPLRHVDGRGPQQKAMEATVQFRDASRNESAFISKGYGVVDISQYDRLTFWYKLSSKDIDARSGLIVRLRDTKLPFVQWVVTGGNDARPGEWRQASINLHERPRRRKFDDTRFARVSFSIGDDDYTNATLRVTVGPLVFSSDPVLRAKYAPKPLAYSPQVRERSWDGKLDALVIRYGGECHYNIEKALRSLPMDKTVRLEYYRMGEHRITHREDALADLYRYDLIALAGVHADAFDRAEQERICDFVASGGGLMVVGGWRTGYVRGGYRESLLKLVLPVDLSDQKDDMETGHLRVKLAAEHEVTAGIPAGALLNLRGLHLVAPKAASQVLLHTNDKPFMIAWRYGQGRVISLATAPYCYYKTIDSFFYGDYYDDLMRQAARWLVGRKPRVKVTAFQRPSARLHLGDRATMAVTVESPEHVQARLQVRKGGEIVHETTVELNSAEPVEFAYDVGDKGDYEFSVAILCDDGTVAALRDGRFEVQPHLRVEPYIVHHKDVTAPGYVLDFAVRAHNRTSAPTKVGLNATIVDADGRELHRFPEASFGVPSGKHKEQRYRYPVPRLADGEYRLKALLSQKGRTVDQAAQTFYVVRELDRSNFFQIMLYQHMGTWPPIVDWDHMKCELDDALAHGYNCIGSTSRGTWKPAYWIRLRNQAESYAQRHGMGISYACNSLVRTSRNKPLKICPSSPEYVPDVEKFLAPRLEEHLKVPRLHDSMTCDEFAIMPRSLCSCEHCRTAFKKRYGLDLPIKPGRIRDAKLRASLVEFYEDYWKKAWQITCDYMKEGEPNFMISNTWTASVCGSRRPDVVFGDLFKWAEHYDYIFGDVYPYAAFDSPGGTDARFRHMRCALAFLRCVAHHYDIPHAYWIENAVRHRRIPARAIRRNAYTAIAQGAKGLLGWGAHFPENRLPQDYPELWEDMGRTFNDIHKIGPLLLKSRRRSRIGLVYSHTDWLFTETYTGPFVRLEWTLDALGRAFDGGDIVYERQIRQGDLAGHRALLLTDLHHFSASAAERLAELVQGGAVVVCDSLPVLDEHDEKLSVFEELFGVQKCEALSAIKTFTWNDSRMQAVVGNVVYRPKADCRVLATFAEDGTPALLERSVGKGRVFLLGFNLTSTYKQAYERELTDRLSALSRFLSGVFARAGVQPYVRSSEPDVEASYLDGDGPFTIVAFNHATTPKKAVISAHDLGFAPQHVVDLLRCEDVPCRADAGKRTLTVPLTLPGLSERVIGVYSDKASAVAVSAPPHPMPLGEDALLSVEIRNDRGQRIPGLSILQLEVVDAKGKTRPEYGGRFAAAGGRIERRISVAINDPRGKWSIRARAWLTKCESVTTFEVR